MQEQIITLNPVKVLHYGHTYSTFINFDKLPKTIGIHKDGMTARIKVEKVRISQRTYWKLGHYCHMFEGYDYTCRLCGLSSTAYEDSVCNCSSSFTIEEHIKNVELCKNR